MLGPVEVWSEGHRLRSFAQKPTALLVAGLVDAGRVVTVDRLVDAIWGEDPPATAAKLVQSYVAVLRLVLHQPGSAPVITTRPGGYVFEAPPAALDLHRFQHLLDRGRQECVRGGHAAAVETLEAALALWRGPALGGPASPLLRAEAERLEEMRTAATEALLTARLEAGGGQELVGELTRLVAAHPLRERPRALLMVALERSGRRAEALAVHRDARRVLREELGVDPGPELTALHARLLTAPAHGHGEEALPPLPGPRAAETGRPHRPAQLPAAPAALTGRAEERTRLLAALEGSTDDRCAPVCVVHGMGGTGKTALALHVAHEAAAGYPDGLLHTNLRGSDPTAAADPAEVLAAFLRALGLPPADVPADPSERAALYRTLLSARRVLVVLDDAADDRQVRPLLPGAGASGALVTSRRTLPALDAALRVALRVLGHRDSLELLDRCTGGSAVAADPEAAAAVARLCGGLPLAIRIVGSRPGTGGRPSLGVLAARLADERHRLDELSAGDLDVRASVSLSYRALPESGRRTFRRLGALGPAAFGPAAAAPLLGVSVAQAGRLVEALAQAHLLEPAGSGADGTPRYRFHDLVRLHACELDVEEPPGAPGAPPCAPPAQPACGLSAARTKAM
ncbi:AfsR/SARP family transcriptional regulator [Streptomyces sp. NRRL S-87]|uniref:AfsR/SARP family transcriptional regulator n=1 Tax=Streptomyces sp. NRRL S-87 TaxID=1463920 RepID=UPI000A590677|nr:AfsR/SARP family transcriptional regulator [Streptomyces sp. NRRL S-87]